MTTIVSTLVDTAALLQPRKKRADPQARRAHSRATARWAPSAQAAVWMHTTCAWFSQLCMSSAVRSRTTRRRWSQRVRVRFAFMNRQVSG
eukprot:6195546-Pleurochrysis_carterae.AAC.1